MIVSSPVALEPVAIAIGCRAIQISSPSPERTRYKYRLVSVLYTPAIPGVPESHSVIDFIAQDVPVNIPVVSQVMAQTSCAATG